MMNKGRQFYSLSLAACAASAMRIQHSDLWSQLNHCLTAAEPMWRPEPFRLVASPSEHWLTPMHTAALDLSAEEHARLRNDQDALHMWLADQLRDEDRTVFEVMQSIPSGGVPASPPSRRTQPRAVSHIMRIRKI